MVGVGGVGSACDTGNAEDAEGICDAATNSGAGGACFRSGAWTASNCFLSLATSANALFFSVTSTFVASKATDKFSWLSFSICTFSSLRDLFSEHKLAITLLSSSAILAFSFLAVSAFNVKLCASFSSSAIFTASFSCLSFSASSFLVSCSFSSKFILRALKSPSWRASRSSLSSFRKFLISLSFSGRLA